MNQQKEYPTRDWYANESRTRGLSVPLCPHANRFRCPKFCKHDIFYSMALAEDKYAAEKEFLDVLLSRWDETELREYLLDPVVTEHEGGIFQYSGLCPEVSYKYYHYYACEMFGYDKQTTAIIEDAIENDPSVLTQLGHKYPWSFLRPMHYSDCELFSLLMIRPIIIDHRRQKPAQEVNPVTAETALHVTPEESGQKLDSGICPIQEKEDVIFIQGFRHFKVLRKETNDYQEFIFNSTQASIIEMLYRATGKTLHYRDLLLNNPNLQSYDGDIKVRRFFRNHPNWRTILRPGAERGYWVLSI